MDLGIDVGATKTLLAVFSEDGQIAQEYKVATPHDYEQFLAAISQVINVQLRNYQFKACCCAVPGWIDFKNSIVMAFGNLPWQNIHIKKDLQEILPNAQILIHNDAKLAGLGEALLLQGRYNKVLYLTISTGIGGGVIIDGVIHPDFINFEPGQMQFNYDGKDQKWESFASGHALTERYGKIAAELADPPAWQAFAKLVATGLVELLAVIQPEVVVFGGGVGAHFEKFKAYLEQDLAAAKNPLVPIPPLLKAQRPEQAVIYGCYDYIKQQLG